MMTGLREQMGRVCFLVLIEVREEDFCAYSIKYRCSTREATDKHCFMQH